MLLCVHLGLVNVNDHRSNGLAVALAAGIISILFIFFWMGFRTRFQFSLRTLLLVVTLSAVLCSWLGVKLRQSRTEHEAAAAIEKLGGHVGWLPQSGLASLPSLLGIHAFATVTLVNLSNTQDADAALQHLKGLSQLQTLYLEDTNVTDHGLETLEALRELKDVYLFSTKVTPNGVKKFQQALPNCVIHLDPYDVL